jgi:hypothetical protein
MHTIKDILNWLESEASQDYVLGYGSLMSHSSRSQYSNIHCPSVMVNVAGYQRGWVTRSLPEQQTYVGAWENQNAKLNAQLVPVTFSADFAKREQDYEFVQVDIEQIDVSIAPESKHIHEHLAEKRVWICRTLETQTAETSHPVNASYVATCLVGCLETGDEVHAHDFFSHTHHWPDKLFDDLDKPNYPRAAALTSSQKNKIRQLLNNYSLL